MLCSPLPFSLLLVYRLAVLDLGWNTLCMVMSFLVSMSVFIRSSRFQQTTAAEYQITETAKVLIFVRTPQNPPHSVSVLGGGFAAPRFVIVAE